MLLNSGLTTQEQPAFDLLLRFFDGEENAERKALALTPMFAVRVGFMLMARGVEITDALVADTVMHILADYYAVEPEIELLWGQRRDTCREK